MTVQYLPTNVNNPKSPLTVTADTTLDPDDNLVVVDTSGAGSAITLTLPDATTVPGIEVSVKLADATQNCIVQGALGQTIDGAGSVTLEIAQQTLNVKSDGAAWQNISNGQAAGGTTLDWKDAVRVATTGPGTLATSFENGDTIDGIVLATGDRILIKDQAAGDENGIYIVQASGAPIRAEDANTNAKVTSGLACQVNEGTANANTFWYLSTINPIVLDTTALVFEQFPSTANLAQVLIQGNTTGANDITVSDGDNVIPAQSAGAGGTANIGSSAFRFAEINTNQLMIGGADPADAPAGEDQVGIGTLSSSTSGFTIMTDSGNNNARICFHDGVAGGAARGELRYANAADFITFRIATADIYQLRMTDLRPVANRAEALGFSGGRWVTSNIQTVNANGGQIHDEIQATVTPASTSQTIDFDNGNSIIIDLEDATGDVTLTLDNAAAGGVYWIQVLQDSGGAARDLIWPANVTWAGGTAPTITPVNDAQDLIKLVFDGTSFLGEFWQNFS